MLAIVVACRDRLAAIAKKAAARLAMTRRYLGNDRVVMVCAWIATPLRGSQ
jgi:hypothetical protein